MFNESMHSINRSREHSQHDHRSTSLISRHGMGRNPKFKIPSWVHCEKCFISYDTDPNMTLVTCGHIFCKSCLVKDKCILPDRNIHCPRCKAPLGHRPLSDSLDPKLQEMFYSSWTDPLLNINLKTLLFMMTKIQNYVKYISHRIRQKQTIPAEVKLRYAAVKAQSERTKKMQKYDAEITTRIELMKKAIAAKCNKFKTNRMNFERFLANKRTAELSYKMKQATPQHNLKFISSGRNESMNRYIDQVRVPSNWPSEYETNDRISDKDSQMLQRSQSPKILRKQSPALNHSRHSNHTPTFRPSVRSSFANVSVNSVSHAQKRLIPSFQRDEYASPSKRAKSHYPLSRKSKPSTSIDELSFLGSSFNTELQSKLGEMPSGFTKFKSNYDSPRSQTANFISSPRFR